LQVAEEHFRRVGYHPTSVASIASEFGMSPAGGLPLLPLHDAIDKSICGRVVTMPAMRRKA